MHSWIKRVGLLLTLSLCSGGSAIAEEKAGEINVDLAVASAIGNLRYSEGFQNTMKCIGVTDAKLNEFFVKFEAEYRACLAEFPFSADNGKGFVSCWEKKSNTLFGGLSTDKALLKKCGGE